MAGERGSQAAERAMECRWKRGMIEHCCQGRGEKIRRPSQEVYHVFCPNYFILLKELYSFNKFLSTIIDYQIVVCILVPSIPKYEYLASCQLSSITFGHNSFLISSVKQFVSVGFLAFPGTNSDSLLDVPKAINRITSSQVNTRTAGCNCSSFGNTTINFLLPVNQTNQTWCGLLF